VQKDSADGDQQFSVTPSFSQSSSSRDTSIYTRAQVEIAFSVKKLHFFQSFFQGQSALSFIVVLLNQYPKTMHSIFSDFAHGIIVHNLADQTFGISHEKSGAARPSVTTHSHPPVTPA